MSPTALEEKFLDSCHKYLPENVSILVAVSGGSDSIALLRLFHTFQDTLNVKKLAIIHVNHGLRGAESDADEQFVRDCAQELDLPFFIKRLSTADLQDSGIELWARRERYSFFKSVMESIGYGWIATGHTRDDQAETVLMRIMRGSGLRGLRGILPVREDGVCRPLLNHSKKELEEWLDTIGQSFRYDSSNSELRFWRNEVRLKIMPLLHELSPDISDNLCALSVRMVHLWEMIVPDIKRWIEAFVVKETKCLFLIQKSGLDQQHIAFEGIRSLFEEYGIRATRVHIELIVQNAKRKGRYLLPGQWAYCSGKESVVFCKQNVSNQYRYDLTIPGVTIFHELNRQLQITIENTPDSSHVLTDCMTAVIDRDTCDEHLVYRTITRGDVFQPFGRKNSTNLLQFLSRQGMPELKRRNIGVIADQYNKVVWVPAVRINEQCKITESTRSVIKIAMKTLNTDI